MISANQLLRNIEPDGIISTASHGSIDSRQRDFCATLERKRSYSPITQHIEPSQDGLHGLFTRCCADRRAWIHMFVHRQLCVACAAHHRTCNEHRERWSTILGRACAHVASRETLCANDGWRARCKSCSACGWLSEF